MTSSLDDTASFYAGHASTYAEDTGRLPPSQFLETFASRLPQAARVLEIGCGSGRDSAWMLSRNLDVHPTDGVAEMAAEASRRLGVPASVLPFDEIDATGAYNAVWANACLLHVPRPRLSGILRRIHAALTPNGLFYASYKAGEGEKTDRFGRYFNYPDEAWLVAAYGDGWSGLEIEYADAPGYDGEMTPWLHVFAST